MAYFNHAFSKRFLGNGASRLPLAPGVNDPATAGGFITTPNVPTSVLADLGKGYFGFFNENYLSMDVAALSGAGCCPLYLASSSLMARDKIGPFHGGYMETNKSKLINPRYIHKMYVVEECTPQQAVLSVGTTPETIVPGLPATGFQGGTTQTQCAKEFYCGETYYLRIDIKGSPALRFLNHNAYQTVSAYTGCCADPTPSVVDPTLVYIAWAEAIAQNPYLKDLVLPVVFDTTGAAWYAPGTTVDPLTGLPFAGNTWDNYVSPAGPFAGTTAGMRLFGAYVETKFGTCSFRVTDFFEKEPVRLYASLVDYNGDPCVFEGLCVYNDCLGLQGTGFGEQVLRDLILSESYLQNFVHTDVRIREITQGDEILNAVDRNALYTRYYILHTVPRYNNPSGVFDNDQYMLEIITEGRNLVLETFLTTWSDNCRDCPQFDEYACTPCVVAPNEAPII